MKFREMTEKTESLIELGNEVEKEVEQCQSQVAVAQVALSNAQAQLSAASETDSEGKPKGNVQNAQMAVAQARGYLEASRRELNRAKEDLDRVNSQKNSHIRRLESYADAEKRNLAQLQRLSEMAFSQNASQTYEGMASRVGEAQRAKAMLEQSLGSGGSSEDIPDGTLNGADGGYHNNLGLSYSSGSGVSGGSNKNVGGWRTSFIRQKNGQKISREYLTKAYSRAVKAGDKMRGEALRNMYELVTFAESLQLTNGDLNFVQDGGIYDELKSYKGYEKHHIPAQSVQKKSKYKLPVVTITKEDHAKTDSYRGRQHHAGNYVFSKEKMDKYKVKTENMIAEGRYIDVVKSEVYNLRDACGNRYDGGLKKYFQIVYDMLDSNEL